MSIEEIQKLLDQEHDVFRSEVEAHLLKHPMGVDYFGMKSCRNPRLIKRLRQGLSVELETMRKVRDFMAGRELDLNVSVPAPKSGPER